MAGCANRIGLGTALLLVLGCGVDPEPRRGILARAGGGGAAAIPAAGTELTTRPFKIAKDTRELVEARQFELAVPDAADRVEWSAGVFARTGTDARFEVQLREGDGEWQAFDLHTVTAGSEWSDITRPLPEGRDRWLRFDASSEDPQAHPLWGSVTLHGPLPAPRRPSVLLISLDTLGADHLGSFRGPADVSPNLDAFLERSASFRRAYAQYGNTLVSHASLFSALYPLHHRVQGAQTPQPLRASLVRALGDAGYRTAAFTEGGFVSAGYGFSVGFDRYEEGNPHVADQMQGWADKTFDAAANWLDGLAPDTQFFLFVHTYEVHNPYLPRDDDARDFANRLTPDDDRVLSTREQNALLLPNRRSTPGPRDLRRLEALHHAEIRSLDALFAQFLERIAPHLEDTLIVVIADHGDQFGEWGRFGHGDSLHDRVVHVPMAFRGPGIQPRAFETPTQLVDVMPTVLEYLELPLPDRIDGRSLADVLRDPNLELAPAPAFAEQRTTRDCTPSPGRRGCPVDRVAVVDDRFKLVDTREPDSQQLYDLRNDPEETEDVAERFPEDVARLRALATAYRNPASPNFLPLHDESSIEPDAKTLQQLRALGYETSESPPTP